MLFLANLSIIEVTLRSSSSASFLSVVSFSLLTKVLVVLCWYLFLNCFAPFDLILFKADLWFAMNFLLLIFSDCKFTVYVKKYKLVS